MIMDFAIAAAKLGPCSRVVMSMVEVMIAGNTEKMPLSTAPKFERRTDMVIMIPARTPRKRIFWGV